MGKPLVSKLAKKEHVAVVRHTVEAEPVKAQAQAKPAKAQASQAQAEPVNNDLGEGVDMNEAEAEGIEQMRGMRLVAKHIRDTSKSVSDQNEIPSDAEYNFSIRNTDEHDKSMGVAKNIQLEAALPKEAKLMDAYFYLEATKPHEDPQSKSCHLSHGDQDGGDGIPRVKCVVPYIKDLVDVYVRAHYDGDQQALSKLSENSDVDVTLHEGHEVLKTSKLSALQKVPLLKRMHHD